MAVQTAVNETLGKARDVAWFEATCDSDEEAAARHAQHEVFSKH